MRLKIRGRQGWALLALPALGACSGAQSALDPAGFEAEAVARLFWVMLVAAAILWVAVLALAFHARRRRASPWQPRNAGRLILWAGAVGPTLLLCALLVYSLRLMPDLRAPGGPLRVEIRGEQFWWRVRYHPPGGAAVESANELRLPVGQRVELSLSSPDVIHSFWVPALAGKMDVIPGRTNRLVLEPSRTGRFRGVCAEFCGASHALMAFTVEVMEPEAFQAWLTREANPAAASAEQGGQALFLKNGCGACHTVRGTPAGGRVGPDLTHLASRPTLGAGTLENTQENRVRFIAQTREIKPAALMPGFGMLPETEIAAIAAWLGTLR